MMKILMAAQNERAIVFHPKPDMELFDIYIDDGYSGANFVEVR